MNLELPSNQKLFPQQAHLTDYIDIIRKRKWVAIIFLFIVVCAVTIVSFSTTPLYKAATQIIIERQSSFINEMADVMATNTIDQDYYQTQYNLLMSRNLAKDVIQELKLWRELGISETQNSDNLAVSSNTSVKPSASSEIGISNTPQEASEKFVPPYPAWIVDWYLSNLMIIPISGTNLVNINFISQSPEIAARVANAHAHAFIAKNMQMQHLFSQQAIEWLKTQIRDQKTKVGTSQREVYEYKYEILRAFSIDDKNLFSLPEISGSTVIQGLYSKLSELKTRRSEFATKYGPKHPKMIEINSSIKQLEQDIINEVEAIRKTLKTELDRIVALEKSTQQIRDTQRPIVSHGEKAINYDMLKLEAEGDQEIYDILLKHAKEINLTGNMERNNIRIVDEAEVPLSPAKPKIFLNIFLSALLGSTFGIGLCFFLEYMDKTIRTPEDIMRRLGLSVLGILPYDKSLKGNKSLALSAGESHNNQNKRREGYNQYAISGGFISKLPLMQLGTSGQVLLVESTAAGEGKTTVLAKSAISLACGGLRVLMVDADLDRPTLHHLFAVKNGKESGLVNAMKGVMSHEIRQGTLSKYSVDDLFSLIALKKQSGQLTIRNDTQTMTAAFVNGRFFHIQSQDNPVSNGLGNMLLRGGFITEDQLKDALERNQRTGQPLGYILINAGYINQEQLQGPLKLQIEERLQKLFSWKQGTFTFEPGRIERYEDKRIYFEEDYTPIISRLSRMSGSRLLENEVFSYIKPVNEPNLSLLPAGIGRTTPDGPLYFALFAKFLDILKQRYDVILVDAPPLLDTLNNVTPLLSLVDGVIFVIKSGQVSIDRINRVTECMKEAKTNIIGAILNQTKIVPDYYFYYKRK
ncbi:MAG: hypothetical protein DCC43_00615 [Candidatus Brocadia sp.]|nr:hypothetical protein [Candidatus Brocadia fulgida]MCC6325490.1 DUF4388 domain-containing protein [Candidatus Brocadia sp.]MCE7910204.1 DUF4388 domain-containing protein [Candidatus Brocadia sp. AMX3]MDG5996833.1 DUF4388 domain-containing protein [Candidatus Brocadia sp.]RIK03328.1 MAG: hypothetical protein DCC43_00615 [Candidatus Brocadia sp.]